MIKKDSFGAWLIWSLGALFFFLEYIVRVSPGVMAQQIIRDFHITAFGLGTLSSYFYYSYIGMQIPVGTLVDKYSVRWLVGSMALLCALSCFLFAFTYTFHLAELCRFLIGITGAFAFVGALKLAHEWFSARYFGFLAGTTQALGMLGASVGAGPLALFVVHWGWRTTLSFLGVLIIILAIFIFVIVRDRPITPEKGASHSLIHGIGIVLKNPMTWINGIIVGLLYAPTAAFGELWGPLYIQRVYNVSAPKAANLVSIIFIGWAIGSPLMGFISDHVKKRKPFILGSAFFSLCFISALLYMPFLPLWILFIIAFLYGLSNVGVSTCYAAACELNPRKYAGTSLGFTNMASIIVGAAFQPLVGLFLDLHWNGKMLEGTRFYSAHDFQTSMIILPLCLILCLFFCFFLQESFPKDQSHF